MRVERMKETEEYKIKERIGEARGRAKNDTGSVLGSEMLQLQSVIRNMYYSENHPCPHQYAVVGYVKSVLFEDPRDLAVIC
jgi:hypothetical protein